MKKLLSGLLTAALVFSMAPSAFAIKSDDYTPTKLTEPYSGYYTVTDQTATKNSDGTYNATVTYRITYQNDTTNQSYLNSAWIGLKLEGEGIYADTDTFKTNVTMSGATTTAFNAAGVMPANDTATGTFYVRGYYLPLPDYAVTPVDTAENGGNKYIEFTVTFTNMTANPGDQVDLSVFIWGRNASNNTGAPFSDKFTTETVGYLTFDESLSESGVINMPMSVVYDMNEGDGTAPSDDTVYTADNLEVTLADKGDDFGITGEDASGNPIKGVFAGWTPDEPAAADVGKIYKKGDTLPTILQPGDTWTIGEEYFADPVTLYAVWAEDTNDDDKPNIYQIDVTYKAVEGTWSENGAAEYVKTYDRLDANGKYSATASVTLTATDIPDVESITPATGFELPANPDDGWTAGTPVGAVLTDDAEYTYDLTRSDVYEFRKDAVDGDVLTPDDGTAPDKPKAGDSFTVTDPNTDDVDTYVVEEVVTPDPTNKPWEKVAICKLDNEGDDGPDGVPDEYEVIVKYVSEDDTKGTITGITQEAFYEIESTDPDTGKVTYKEEIDVTATGSEATAEDGYAFDMWTNDKNTDTDENAAGGAFAFGNQTTGQTITITANFDVDDDDDDIPDKYQVKVSFTVNDGTWTDGGEKTIEKTFLLTDDGTDTGNRDEDGKHTIVDGDIPSTAGIVPAAGYAETGNWNTDPGDPTTLTEFTKADRGKEYVYDLDAAITYTYVNGETGDTFVPTDAPDVPEINGTVHDDDGTTYFIRDISDDPNDPNNKIVTCYPDNDDDEIPDYIQITVKLNVVNGTWSDGETDPIEYKLTLTSDGTATDGSDPDKWDEDGFAEYEVPTGMIANENYKEEGAWDTVPSGRVTKDDKTDTDPNVEYTYTFEESEFSFGDEDGNDIDVLKIPRWEGFEGAVSGERAPYANIKSKNVTLKMDGEVVTDIDKANELISKMTFEKYNPETETFAATTEKIVSVDMIVENGAITLAIAAKDTNIVKVKLGDNCELVVIIPGNLNLDAEFDPSDCANLYKWYGSLLDEEPGYGTTINGTEYDLWMLMSDMDNDGSSEYFDKDREETLDPTDCAILYKLYGSAF
jgi:hypothetical protein